MIPAFVMEPAVAPVVIPAATAAPITRFEIAPTNLSNKGRTDKVKASSR